MAILVVAESPDPSGGLLGELQSAAPWVPGCVVGPSPATLSRQTVVAGSRDHVHPRIVDAGRPPDAALARQAAAAIVARLPPTPTDLARWISTRLHRPEWLADLAAAMTRPPQGEAHATGRALRRWLARIGPLARHEWRRLAMLAGQSRHAVGIDRLALQAGMNVDYFRGWTRRLLGLPATDYRHLPGWEPVLELALRRAGLVLAPEWTPSPPQHKRPPLAGWA
jgi:hypothetical protein